MTNELMALPHNLDAERAVLGALLIDQEALGEVVGLLQPGDFYLDAHGDVYRGMLSIFAGGGPIDTLTLADELERQKTLERVGGIEALAALQSATPTAANVVHYARIVKDAATKRGLIRAAGRVAGVGYDEAVAAASAIEAAEKEIFTVSDSGRARGQWETPGPGLAVLWQGLETAHKKGPGQALTGVPSGFAELDAITYGFQPSDLVIVAARPGVGKTSFVLNIARHATLKCGARVGLFSLEMSRDALLTRLLCNEAGVDLYRLQRMQLTADEWTRVARAIEALAPASLFIDATAGLSIMEMRAMARRLMATGPVDLLIVDYLQLITPARRSDSRTQEVTEISAGLKTLAREMNVPVIAVSQLSRESERRTDRRPQLSDLRDSGSIEQDADIVMFLYRPGMHEEGKDPGVTELNVSKNRNGPQARLSLYFSAKQTAFHEVDRVHGQEGSRG